MKLNITIQCRRFGRAGAAAGRMMIGASSAVALPADPPLRPLPRVAGAVGGAAGVLDGTAGARLVSATGPFEGVVAGLITVMAVPAPSF
ncbi:MAG: hypothetical protein NTW20_13980 [Rhodobacterales bacterium]|nr:hypothetical protein [Rhodobacterales bacterium]